MQTSTLVLRDIHQPPAPPWWPPAPGWWLLAMALVLVALIAWYRRRTRRRRRLALLRLFDAALAAADGRPAPEIAAMSELLRRAARRRDAGAATLQGERWLEFLDAGDPRRPFSEGVGRLLLEGGFRPDADPAEVASLRARVRERFLGWMSS